MIDGAKKYVGKHLIWQGREIEITNCFSCCESDYFEYRFTDDVYQETHQISIFDREFLYIL